MTTMALEDFKLVGELRDGRAAFTLTANAQVDHPKGGSLDLLSGAVALTEVSSHPKWRLRAEQNRFILVCDRAGKFPIQLKFDAAVRQSEGWHAVEFRVAPGPLQTLLLQGLGADTQFEFPGAARPERTGDAFRSVLPSDGSVKLAWKETRPEAEGKLFYAAEMMSQISVSPGLMREVGLFQFKVMQGEMSRLVLLLRGAGEVTRVQGDQVLAWKVEPLPKATEREGGRLGEPALPSVTERRLVIQFNQPQKDQCQLQVQAQTPLGAFPQTADVLQLRPEGATRFAGYVRIVNEGAVRLEVAQASGLSQISPEHFPESDATRAALRPTGSQRFAYRFSGADFGLRIQADQIQPELAVSQVLAYRLGENELAIDDELELDIREAPLRELLLRVPKGYVIARLHAAGVSDYFLREAEEQSEAELRIVYGQPVSGRHLVQLRLERNKALGEATWTLPRIEVPKARSMRGHLAVTADAGFRLTPERTQALNEIATAFFPRKVAGIQAAFRLNDPAWQAALRVDRLPQTVQADVLHLFSIGEGIAYGSSLINYVVSGAPVSTFKIELSDEYFNLEFIGKDIRNWQKTEGGYLVQLHTPVSGTYTLLATYERPFKAQGETLAFSGARPLDAQSEQGHTLVISACQFQVQPAEVSAGLLALETGEVPPDYRLFFDAPILAAYRYTARPFNLQLALRPLAQGDSLSQVVDRAALTTRISKEGQVLTEARYFVKNRGNPHLRLSLPEGTQLWSASVNGAAVVPVTDANAHLVPLPQGTAPDAVLTLDLKLAAQARNPDRVRVSAPGVNVPVMLAEWKLEPDAGQRLVYRSGSLTPAGGVPDISGFAELARAFTHATPSALASLLMALVLVGAALVVWRRGTQTSVHTPRSRHRTGMGLGLLAFVLGLVALANLAQTIGNYKEFLPRGVVLLAPVQQTGSAMSVEVSNLEEKASAVSYLGYAWPALLALAAWGYGGLTRKRSVKAGCHLGGWMVLAWAALRAPNGAGAFVIVLMLFLVLQVMVPALRQLWQTPPPALPSQPEGSAASAAIALALGVAWMSLAGTGWAAEPRATNAVQVAPTSVVAESVLQDIRIEGKFALATARIRWQAEKGQTLPLLWEPAVLTHIHFPSNAVKLVQASMGSRRAQQVLAQKGGTFDLEMQYQLPVTKKEVESGVTLPVPYGLVNRLKLTVINADVDVLASQAVSIQRQAVGSNTLASLVLAPASEVSIGWKPRSRDVKREKPVFYAELAQLYVPAAGVVEGVHLVSIRPAQGEIGELSVEVPKGATITDVSDAAAAAVVPDTKRQAPAASVPLVSLWRFDPDTRRLRVTLNPAQSRPFALLVRSQVATGPLPFEQSVGLMSVENAAGQIGLMGIATGNEVQLDTVRAEPFAPINLEDFPGAVASVLQSQVPGLTVRRAFRYADTRAAVALQASAVEPDVRVQTQDTVSLGEDRTVLAANATVDITRAGIFRLSFVMPPGFDVESISGSALSHWTEFKCEAGRLITLHLSGKTEGQHQFAINLAGPGARAAQGWVVPQLVLREANKQSGTLVLVPEQGLRLLVTTCDGLTQLDPLKSGIRQKGVLAFRLLQTPRNLTLNIEQVDPWIQVTSLQHAAVNEAQVKVTANLQYQVENTGLKAFRVLLPTNAESVRFQGEQVADFLAVAGVVTNGLQAWDIKLHRRVMGSYLLQTTYQLPVPGQAAEMSLRGLQAAEVNLQRGFVSVQAGGRLQVRAERAPAALQPAEWQSIPRGLRQDLGAVAPNFAYRLVEPAFELPLQLNRHEAAKLLAARVNQVAFSSVISDSGVMLTQVKLELLPGDKRLLSLTLPREAQFWFAFVNQGGVWPWREQNRILIPLEAHARGDKAIPVELFYSCQVGAPGSRSLDLELLAPKFDLPLENLTWRVSLSDRWQLKKWSGALQLQQEEKMPQAVAIDLQTYLQNEATQQRERTREAEELLTLGNSALAQGDPQQARRAFQAAYGLSAHDAAFNEDARVQLHNIKLQQALIGLNVRQAATAGDPGSLGGKLRDWRSGKELAYTQQDAKAIIDRNSADDNAAWMRLAGRLIQQQDAAVSRPAAIRARIPEQGSVLTFQRAVVVEPWADLQMHLQATAATGASWLTQAGILLGTCLLLGVLGWVARPTSRGAHPASTPES